MMNIPLPRLLNSTGGLEREVRPIKVALNLNITPLSSATIDLPKDENLPARGFVELFNPNGSVGVFRVRSPQDTYGEGTTTAELEHAISEVGDYLVLEDYDEMQAAGTAMSTVFSHYRGSKWQLGSVTALGNTEIALQAKHVNVLEAMLALLSQVPNCMMVFDFSTSPWTVGFAARGDEVAAEGRLSRNVNSAKIIYDDTELCTRAYYSTTTNSGGQTLTVWHHVDADTLPTYGLVEREVYVDSDYTPEEIDRVVTTYLNAHKHPRISIEISAEDLSEATGEALDTFVLGKLFRLALPDYGVVLDRTITALAWDNVYDYPEEVVVKLADEEDTAVTFIHELSATGGGGGAKKEIEDKFKEFYTEFERTDYYIDQYARHVDRQGNILQQAGMYLDANGVLQYAQDNERNIQSHIQTQADRISLVVEGTGQNAHIKSAEIVASINDEGSLAYIQADKIKLNGKVIEASGHFLSSAFTADEVDCTHFYQSGSGGNFGVNAQAYFYNWLHAEGGIIFGYDGAGTITGPTADFQTLKLPYNGSATAASWRSYSARYCILSSLQYFLYSSARDNYTPSGNIWGRLVTSYTDTTIHYLGGAST